MALKYPRRIFIAAAVICVVLRVYLHRFCIDPETGFYSGGAPVAVIYYVLLIAAVAALLLLGLRNTPEKARVVMTLPLRVITLAASVGVAILAVPSPGQITGPDYLPHPFPVIFLRLFLLSAAPFITVLLLVYLAVKSKDALAHVNGVLMLLPVIWMAAVLLTRFMDYTASRHVSDQMLTIVTLAFATLFLLPMGRAAAGITPEKAARQLSAFGLPFGLLALSTCAGILVGPNGPTHLALSTMESVAVLLLGVFAAAMVFSLKVPD